jgi:hypothetical protein
MQINWLYSGMLATLFLMSGQPAIANESWEQPGPERLEFSKCSLIDGYAPSAFGPDNAGEYGHALAVPCAEPIFLSATTRNQTSLPEAAATPLPQNASVDSAALFGGGMKPMSAMLSELSESPALALLAVAIIGIAALSRRGPSSGGINRNINREG